MYIKDDKYLYCGRKSGEAKIGLSFAYVVYKFDE